MDIQEISLPELVKIAKEAGKLLLTHQSGVKRIESDKDFLTTADLKSDSLIFKRLVKLTPNIPIYSEEGKLVFLQHQKKL